VKTYRRGSLFGERAFRKNTPRAAIILTMRDVIVAPLDREAFFRLLGPVEEIMRKTAYVKHYPEGRPPSLRLNIKSQSLPWDAQSLS
jgi:CRP-like cAMP-binding protein